MSTRGMDIAEAHRVVEQSKTYSMLTLREEHALRMVYAELVTWLEARLAADQQRRDRAIERQWFDEADLLDERLLTLRDVRDHLAGKW